MIISLIIILFLFILMTALQYINKRKKNVIYRNIFIYLVIALILLVINNYSYPELKLLGKKEINLSLNEKYIDPGYKIVPNNKKYKVVIDNNIDENKTGSYEVKYSLQVKNKIINKVRKVNVIDNISIADLWSKGYISIVPKLKEFENQDLQSYIIITYGNFSMNATNPQFRDNTITFDIICPTDYWDIGDYRVRPLKIAGYIDAILDNGKLTGIGNTQFLSCQQLVLDENFSGYSLTYSVIHGSDDKLI